MQLTRLDHLVLTVEDIDASVRFYTEVLGMRHEQFGEARHALLFGEQKINLHKRGHELKPRAAQPTPGSGDLCFLTDATADTVLAHLQEAGVAIESGPIERTGAHSRLTSIYLRDPDGNLIEISHAVR